MNLEALIQLKMPEVVKRSRYRATGRNLIILPKSPDTPHCDRVLDRLNASSLERPPEPEELTKFDTLIRVVQGKPKEGDDLKVQSIYTSAENPLVNLGTVLPEYQIALNKFQTLTGLLYPSAVKWEGYNIDYFEGEDVTDYPDGYNPLLEKWIEALDPKRVWQLTYLLSPRKQAKALESLLFPEDQTHRLGIIGLGDIGTYVASMIRRTDIAKSGITDIFVGGSRTEEKVKAQVLELKQINIEGVHQPNVHEVMPDKEDTFFQECDIILILTAGNIPPFNDTDIDIRSTQFGENISIITKFLQSAEQKQYDGQILMASDPVEQLTMGMYLKMKELGWDIANHQFAGFGGMINRSRAKAIADQTDLDRFLLDGRVFGPHGKMVVAIPTHDSRFFNHRQAEALSLKTGHSNYRIREEGEKPFIGPSVLITHGILDMLGQEGQKSGLLYASPFIPSDDPNTPGAFFGSRVEYHPLPGAWTPRVDYPPLDQVINILKRAHQWTSITSHNPDSLENDPFTDDENKHPAFHPKMHEDWLDLVMNRVE